MDVTPPPFPPCFSAGKNNFNFLRLLFAFMVVIGHCRDISGFDYPVLYIVDTHIAVCGFFIISGFLITKSCLYTRSLKEYCIKRAKRLLPAYVFIIFFAAFFCHYFLHYLLANTFPILDCINI
ncbi:MAG: acyltransferase family protein [Bacteroidales bacterium]|jgi:peptidoglycan/LPS O-acetylase OafA/YrhL|nr:acyltransferase family protein [Bacteroidales bacterium]